VTALSVVHDVCISQCLFVFLLACAWLDVSVNVDPQCSFHAFISCVALCLLQSVTVSYIHSLFTDG